jgi:hypothetical protein
MCVLAAPALLPRHDSAAAADPLAFGDTPAITSAIALAHLTFASQEQSPAPDRSTKTIPAPGNSPSLRAVKQHEVDERQRVSPSSSAEAVMSCLEVARDIDPELGRELVRKHEKNPAEFEHALRTGQVGRGLWSLVQLRQRDPHLYQLKISEMTQALQINRKAAELHEAMKTSDTGRIDSLKTQLRELLQLQLAMSLKSRGEYLCAIEDQVKKLRDEIEHDAKNFHSIVDARLRQQMENPPQTDPTAVIPAVGKPSSGSPRTP